MTPPVFRKSPPLFRSLVGAEFDVVLMYAAVTGTRKGELFEETYVKKVYPRTMLRRTWSAIQVTTASSLCCVLDLVLAQPSAYRGFIRQEHFSLQDVLDNRFGDCFRS